MKEIILSLAVTLLLISCKETIEGPLPIYGRIQVVEGDSIRHTIPNFEFTDQDSNHINNSSFSENIYLADFFFTSCPSICPKVMKQMLRLHDEFIDTDLVKLVSYTIDPKRDDVAKLKKYADALGVSAEKWHFLTGEKDSLLDLADDYFVVAYEDPDAPGGFDHSGKIILVDKNRHIRAFAEGTDADDVTDLIHDIKRLIKEYQTIEN